MKRRDAVTAILAAVPALLLALSAWIQADARAHEAESAKQEKARAYDSYGEYVTEQLHRDEALLKALRECETMLRLKPALWSAYAMGSVIATSTLPDAALGHPRPDGARVGVAAPGPAPTPEPQAQVVLDEIARREGWKP